MNAAAHFGNKGTPSHHKLKQYSRCQNPDQHMVRHGPGCTLKSPPSSYPLHQTMAHAKHRHCLPRYPYLQEPGYGQVMECQLAVHPNSFTSTCHSDAPARHVSCPGTPRQPFHVTSTTSTHIRHTQNTDATEGCTRESLGPPLGKDCQATIGHGTFQKGSPWVATVNDRGRSIRPSTLSHARSYSERRAVEQNKGN